MMPCGTPMSSSLRLAWRIQGLVRLTTSKDDFKPDEAPLAIRTLLAHEVARATGRTDSVDFEEAETILDSILAA